MKVILSRKGFDSGNGGYPSPILPDGTLLSMPIPSSDVETFQDIVYEGVSYLSILEQLTSNQKFKNMHCHLDPDIRRGVRKAKLPNWKPAFGQFNGAQGRLRNDDVKVGDLFLFFGWFRETEGDIKKGTLHYKNNSPDLHVIYGYLQIGQMISDPETLVKNYPFHPHAAKSRRGIVNKNGTDKNMLYLPSEELSFDHSKNGYGVFSFSEKLVLTLPGQTKSIWKNIPALAPDCFIRVAKNCATNEGYQYNGIWQEKVSKPNNETVEWAKSLLRD